MKKYINLTCLCFSVVFSLNFTPIAAAQEESRTFEYLVENESKENTPYQVKALLDKEYSSEVDYGFDYPKVIAIRIYDDKSLVQTIEVETYNTGNYHVDWPELVDVNFDGYADLSLMVSTTNYGSFYTFWLYNPNTHRFDETNAVELPDPVFDEENRVIISAPTVPRAYLSSISVDRWEGNELVRADYATGYLFPFMKDGVLLYDEISVDDYNNQVGFVYSMMLEEMSDGTLKRHESEKGFVSQNESYLLGESGNHPSLEAFKVIVWQTKDGKLTIKETHQIMQWVQSKDENGKLIDEWCPVIPYADLDNNKIDTILLDYPNEESQVKLCEQTNPLAQ